jgi:hypothetical protein
MEKNTRRSSLKRRMVEFLPEFDLRNTYTLIACQPAVTNKSSELVIEHNNAHLMTEYLLAE